MRDGKRDFGYERQQLKARKTQKHTWGILGCLVQWLALYSKSGVQMTPFLRKRSFHEDPGIGGCWTSHDPKLNSKDPRRAGARGEFFGLMSLMWMIMC